MKTFFPVAFAFLLVASQDAFSYQQPTHRLLSIAAVQESDLAKSPQLLLDLGLRSIDDEGQTFPNRDDNQKTIPKLIEDGADFEDDGRRSVNHFYDPANDRPLTVVVGLGERSPDWALEDLGEVVSVLAGKQEFSYGHAREHLFSALTSNAEAERDTEFGLVFQILGQVIHHVQDMAQPQHTRNDAHLDGYPVIPTSIGLLPNPAYNPSWYEFYTNAIRAQLSFGGYAPVVLPTARSYWHTDNNRGIADYSNRGFVTQGTNFRWSWGGLIRSHPDYDLPVFDPQTETKIDVTNLIDGTDLEGILTFYGLNVADNYIGGEPVLNGLATTVSVFDKYLKQYPYSGPRGKFSLNHINFLSAHTFLIPRAVGYSAGLINHFFRGRLEINSPDDGIFAVVDHSTIDVNNEGYKTVKLKLRNVTPDIEPQGAVPVPQEMSEGELVAIVKYFRNRCYRQDLQGEMNTDNVLGSPVSDWATWSFCDGRTFVSGPEEIAVSNTITISIGGNTIPRGQSEDFVFDFSNDPIPVDIRDAYLQVVYRGSLGSGSSVEEGTVVVGTKDISEPTVFQITNLTDYFGWAPDGPQESYPTDQARLYPSNQEPVEAGPKQFWETYQIRPVSLENLEVKIGDTIVATVPELPPGRLTRISVLMEPLEEGLFSYELACQIPDEPEQPSIDCESIFLPGGKTFVPEVRRRRTPAQSQYVPNTNLEEFDPFSEQYAFTTVEKFRIVVGHAGRVMSWVRTPRIRDQNGDLVDFDWTDLYNQLGDLPIMSPYAMTIHFP